MDTDFMSLQYWVRQTPGPDAGYAVDKILRTNPSVVDQLDEHGNAAIHHCVLNEDNYFTDKLLKFGADLNIRASRTGYTPIYLAASKGNYNNIRKLYDYSKKRNVALDIFATEETYGWNPLHVAADAGHRRAVMALVQEICPKPQKERFLNTTDLYDRTPLQLVIEQRADPALCLWMCVNGARIPSVNIIREPSMFESVNLEMSMMAEFEYEAMKKQPGDDVQFFGHEPRDSCWANRAKLRERLSKRQEVEVGPLFRLLTSDRNGIIRLPHVSITSIRGLLEFLHTRKLTIENQVDTLIEVWLFADALQMEDLTNHCQKLLLKALRSRIERHVSKTSKNVLAQSMNQSMTASFFGPGSYDSTWKGLSLSEYLVALYLSIQKARKDYLNSHRNAPDRLHKIEGLVGSCVLHMLRECLNVFKGNPEALVTDLFASVERLLNPPSISLTDSFMVQTDVMGGLREFEKCLSSEEILRQIKPLHIKRPPTHLDNPSTHAPAPAPAAQKGMPRKLDMEKLKNFTTTPTPTPTNTNVPLKPVGAGGPSRVKAAQQQIRQQIAEIDTTKNTLNLENVRREANVANLRALPRVPTTPSPVGPSAPVVGVAGAGRGSTPKVNVADKFLSRVNQPSDPLKSAAPKAAPGKIGAINLNINPLALLPPGARNPKRVVPSAKLEVLEDDLADTPSGSGKPSKAAEKQEFLTRARPRPAQRRLPTRRGDAEPREQEEEIMKDIEETKEVEEDLIGKSMLLEVAEELVVTFEVTQDEEVVLQPTAPSPQEIPPQQAEEEKNHFQDLLQSFCALNFTIEEEEDKNPYSNHGSHVDPIEPQRPEELPWSCELCTFINSADSQTCELCEASRNPSQTEANRLRTSQQYELNEVHKQPQHDSEYNEFQKRQEDRRRELEEDLLKSYHEISAPSPPVTAPPPTLQNGDPRIKYKEAWEVLKSLEILSHAVEDRAIRLLGEHNGDVQIVAHILLEESS